MITNNYLASGGDGYIMLKGKPGYDTGFTDADALAEYIMYLGTIEQYPHEKYNKYRLGIQNKLILRLKCKKYYAVKRTKTAFLKHGRMQRSSLWLSNSEFKSFKSKEDAINYLTGSNSSKIPSKNLNFLCGRQLRLHF